MKNQTESRKLTEREQRRVAMMEETTQRLAQAGYTRKDVTLSIKKANLLAILWTIPFLIIFGAGYILVNGKSFAFGDWDLIALCVLCLACTVVHELIHGLTWSLMAPSHFRAIEFGIMKESITPYCTCKEPLQKGEYIAGSLMPCLILGIIPCVVSIFCCSTFLLLFGLIMIMGAGGDLTVIWYMLRYKSDSDHLIIMDHPSECGFIVFQGGRA